MTIKVIELRPNNFLVSEHQTGVYATEKAAKLAVRLNPTILAEKWQACLAADPDGTLTEEALLCQE